MEHVEGGSVVELLSSEIPHEVLSFPLGEPGQINIVEDQDHNEQVVIGLQVDHANSGSCTLEDTPKKDSHVISAGPNEKQGESVCDGVGKVAESCLKESSDVTVLKPVEGAAAAIQSSVSGNSTTLAQSVGYLVFNPEDQTLSVATHQGTPVLVLANNADNGTYEANVMLDHATLGNLMKLPDMQTKLLVPMPDGNLKQVMVPGLISPTSLNAQTPLPTGQEILAVHKEKTESGKQVFVCDFDGCGRSFSTMGYMRCHQAVHKGQKTLCCNIQGCGRKFSWPAHLKYHQLTHNGDRSYVCPVEECGARFYTSQRLNVHMRTHTGEKPFFCPKEGCNKSFTTAGNLKNHVRIHTGERPFQCPFEGCGRCFAEHSSLRKHKLVHSGDKPYVCNFCDKTFSQSGSRNVHMKRHQLEQTNNLSKTSETQLKGDLSPTEGNMVVDLDTSGVLIVQPWEEENLQYQDLQGAESVVFSHAVADHVVTVTTQPAENDPDHIDLAHTILGNDAELCRQDHVSIAGRDSIPIQANGGANVVVLSQPEEMVTMATTGYQQQQGQQAGHDDMSYRSGLLNAELVQHDLDGHMDTHSDGGTEANIMASLLSHEDIVN